jgi:NTP pyrophosphatase (non-canonical NTP hydrolase)
MNDFDKLTHTNLLRQKHWGGSENIDGLFRAVELGEETGEVLGAVKKLQRADKKVVGNTASRAAIFDNLKEEIGDVVICASLLAIEYDIDLGSCVIDKFNATSRKHDIPVFLTEDMQVVSTPSDVTLNDNSVQEQAVVYAFAGKRGTGKSTASKVLTDMGFVDLKFADPLKNMLRAMYRTCDVDPDTIERKIEGDLKEVPCDWLRGKTPRHAMQTLGTEWREMIATDLWSSMFVKRVRSGKYGSKIVCSDFRFPGHEEDALQELDAYTYRIIRPSIEDDEVSAHASEANIDKLKVGATVRNNGSIQDLHEWVRDLVESNAAVAEYMR